MGRWDGPSVGDADDESAGDDAGDTEAAEDDDDIEGTGDDEDDGFICSDRSEFTYRAPLRWTFEILHTVCETVSAWPR